MFFLLWESNRHNLSQRIIVCVIIDATYNAWFYSMRIHLPCLLYAKDGCQLKQLHHNKLLYLRVLAVVAVYQIWPVTKKFGKCAAKLPWSKLPRSKLYPTHVLWVHSRLIFTASLLSSSSLPDLFWRVLGRISEIKTVYHAATWNHLSILQSIVSDLDYGLCIPVYAKECSKSWKRDVCRDFWITARRIGSLHLWR